MNSLDNYERAKRYAANYTIAVSGSGGSRVAMKLACALIRGFELSRGEAHRIFSDWSERCDPPWSESEIEHKLDSAEVSKLPLGYLAEKVIHTQSDTRGWEPEIRVGSGLRVKVTPPYDMDEARKRRLARAGERLIMSMEPLPVPNLTKLSPIQPPTDPDSMFELFLTLFSPTDTLWIGHVSEANNPGSFTTVSEWLRRGIPGDKAFWTSTCTYKVNASSRCIADHVDWRYMVLESDKHSKPLQVAMTIHLIKCGFPVVMVVDSAGSSLHTWLRVDDCDVVSLRWLLCGVPDGSRDGKRAFYGGAGYDDMNFHPSQPCRLPGAIRPPAPNKPGGIQSILYFNPAMIPSK